MSDGAPKLAHWPDDCNHGADTYIGTFTHNGIAHDVYVFTDKSGRAVCIRNGRHSEYWSPGTVESMRETLRHIRGVEPYASALALIEKQATKDTSHGQKRPQSERRAKADHSHDG